MACRNSSSSEKVTLRSFARSSNVRRYSTVTSRTCHRFKIVSQIAPGLLLCMLPKISLIPQLLVPQDPADTATANPYSAPPPPRDYQGSVQFKLHSPSKHICRVCSMMNTHHGRDRENLRVSIYMHTCFRQQRQFAAKSSLVGSRGMCLRRIKSCLPTTIILVQ